MLNKVLILLLVTFSFVSVHAENTEKQLKQIRKKNVAKEEMVSTIWEPVSFDINLVQLPVNYKGIDSNKFYAFVRSKIDAISKKDEFETTEQYQLRTSDVNRILSPISSSNFYAFKVDPNYAYDADQQKMIPKNPIRADRNERSAGDVGKYKFIYVQKLASSTSSYVGSNANGGLVEVSKTTTESFVLSIDENDSLLNNSIWIKSDYNKSFFSLNTVFNLPLEKAKSIGSGNNVGIIFVGQIIQPKFTKTMRWIEATFSQPQESYSVEYGIPFKLNRILFYVISSGEILKQISL